VVIACQVNIHDNVIKEYNVAVQLVDDWVTCHNWPHIRLTGIHTCLWLSDQWAEQSCFHFFNEWQSS